MRTKQNIEEQLYHNYASAFGAFPQDTVVLKESLEFTQLFLKEVIDTCSGTPKAKAAYAILSLIDDDCDIEMTARLLEINQKKY